MVLSIIDPGTTPTVRGSAGGRYAQEMWIAAI